MKLILTQEVAGLGVPGEIVEVKDGYGRNFLVPRGFAFAWSKGAEKQIDGIKRSRDARAIRDKGHAADVKAQVEALRVTVQAKAGEAGRLFGSVSASDVVEAIKAAGGPLLDKRSVTIESAIKTLGSHRVSVALLPDVTASFAIEVVSA